MRTFTYLKCKRNSSKRQFKTYDEHWVTGYNVDAVVKLAKNGHNRRLYVKTRWLWYFKIDKLKINSPFNSINSFRRTTAIKPAI